jgi:hypothetical protein
LALLAALLAFVRWRNWGERKGIFLPVYEALSY